MTEINNKRFKKYISAVDEELKKFTENKPFYSKKLIDAMEYSLSAPGKRIRPVLALEFCHICGGSEMDFVDIACCVEMVHCFSLIHDDLPCMDDDDYRRGQLSCHKKFDEASALLAGDALSTLPYEVMTSAALSGRISYETANGLINSLSKASGIGGMIGGQAYDLYAEDHKIDLEGLNTLQKLKTGRLISSACEMGCILAGADAEAVKRAGEFGEKLGLAFQIRDDILDVTSTLEELGKPVGSDSSSHKSTYVTMLGIENSEKTAERLTDEALEILKFFGDSGFLRELTKALLKRKK